MGVPSRGDRGREVLRLPRRRYCIAAIGDSREARMAG
jgi:hypothetical protein